MPLTRNPIRKAQPEATRPGRSTGAAGRMAVSLPDRSAQDSLANRLGQEIVAGVFPPGSLLPSEMEMRQRFAVSRTALREAYQVLAGKAMIVARPKVGTGIRPKSDWNMLDPQVLAWHLQTLPIEDLVDDLSVLRRIVEPEAAAIAAGLRSDETMAKIEAAFADMERFRDGSGDLVSADARFHLAILAGSGNAFLGALGSLIRAALFVTFELSWEGAARMQDHRLAKHRAIMEAIRVRDSALARREMTELLDESLQDVRDSLARRGRG